MTCGSVIGGTNHTSAANNRTARMYVIVSALLLILTVSHCSSKELMPLKVAIV